MIRSSVLLVALGAALVSAAGAGCAGEEALNPTPTGASASTTTSGATTGAAGSTTGAGGAGPVVREVFTRNPFGETKDNLLVDGDFEFSILPEGSAGQNGWIGFGSNGEDASILGETGGLCKSGLRCGLVKKGMILFGRGTAAPGEKRHLVTIWTKPVVPGAETPCKVLRPRLIACDTFDSLGNIVAPNQPDENGWCKFEDQADKSSIAACLYIDVLEDTIVDAASMVGVEESGAAPLPPIHFDDTPAEREKLRFMRDVVHRKIRFGKMPELNDGPEPIPY